MFEFLWWQLLVLAPLPLLLRLLPRPRAEDEVSDALRMPEPAWQVMASAVEREQSRQGINPIILWSLWLLLLCAAARPQWVGEPVQLPQTGRDLILAVDVSGSMQTDDMVISGRQVNRLQAVKAVLTDFIERRDGDHLGLILFGSQAYVQAPVTFDQQTLKRMLMEAFPTIAGGKTAIGDAIGLAVKRLRQRPNSNKVVFLLTDGVNTAGELEPRKAADLAASEGIRLYTIGMGAEQMRQPIMGGLLGSRIVNPAADLDEPTLRYIAETTGGRYFRAQDTETLREIYAELDELEPLEQNEKTFRPSRALFIWPLGAALLVALLLAASHLRLPGLFRIPSVGSISPGRNPAARQHTATSGEPLRELT